MAKARLNRALDRTTRTGTCARGCNPRVRHEINAARQRERHSFKTIPIVPSLPNEAARCAFASSGAQRARDRKFAECRFLSGSLINPITSLRCRDKSVAQNEANANAARCNHRDDEELRCGAARLGE